MSKTARIDLRIPPATKQRWETTATNAGITLTHLITTAVEHTYYNMYTQTGNRAKTKPPTPPPTGPPRGLKNGP